MKNTAVWMSALAPLLVGSGALADVLVVAADGTGAFLEIQPAVDAAANGDTLLVKSGTYAGFAVDGKGLTIAEDTGATVTVSSTITIRNVPAASTFSMVGVAVHFAAPSASAGARALHAHDNPGALRFYDCALTGQDAVDLGSPCDPDGGRVGGDGMWIHACPNIAFSWCTSVGGTGGDYHCATLLKGGGPGGTGLFMSAATVAAYDCIVRGGDGGDGGEFPLHGGDGLRKAVGTGGVFVSHCRLQGGRGGDIIDLNGVQTGDGGDGLFASPAQVLDCVAIAGPAGTVTKGGGGFGSPGEDGVATLGAIFEYSVANLRFHVPSPVRENTTVQMVFAGEPGDRVYLLSGSETIFQNVPSWRGFQLVQSPPVGARVRKMGVIPPSGALTRTLHVESLPPGVDASTRFLQAYRLRGDGVTLGSFAPLVVLDSAF